MKFLLIYVIIMQSLGLGVFLSKLCAISKKSVEENNNMFPEYSRHSLPPPPKKTDDSQESSVPDDSPMRKVAISAYKKVIEDMYCYLNRNDNKRALTKGNNVDVTAYARCVPYETFAEVANKKGLVVCDFSGSPINKSNYKAISVYVKACFKPITAEEILGKEDVIR